MMKTSISPNLRDLLIPSGWRWPLVMMCYCVLFHMTPTIWMPIFWLDVSIAAKATPFLILFLGVSGYLGWKAKESIMVDAALTAMAYFLLFDNIFGTMKSIPPSWQRDGLSIIVIIWAGMLGYVGAGTGRLLHEWRLKSALQAETV